MFLIDCSDQIAYVKQMDTKNATKPSIVIICGPTASGKTNIAITLAKLFSGEIVGADSMQIYRHMDIGTATPTKEEQEQIQHHLINKLDPTEEFDAVRYQKMANAAISQILEKKKVPFIVGGTGLYIKTLLQGMFVSPEIPPEVRLQIRERASTEGTLALHNELEKKDPEAAARIHPNDRYRIVRALETVVSTGETISTHQQSHQFKNEFYRALKIGISLPRNELYTRIDKRVDQMIQEGLIDEVKALLQKGVSPSVKSMQSIGYRHVIQFLEGDLSADEWVEKLKQDTRRYAKRQMTWFKADPDIHWVLPEEIEKMRCLIHTFLTAKAI